MEVKKALVFNTFVGVAGKVSTIIIRLIQVPFLLSVFGAEEYGRWLLLTSIPTWLTLANLGFSSVAANDMAIAITHNDVDRAQRSLSTSLGLIILLSIVGSLLGIGLIPNIGWEKILGLSADRHAEIIQAMGWLTCTVFVSFTGEVFLGRFRAARKYHQGMMLWNSRPWLDLLCLVVAVKYSSRFDYLAFGLFVSTCLFILLIRWLSLRSLPELKFSFSKIQPSIFKDLVKKGLAFQAFPLGNVLLYQGNLFIVQAILGPAMVALFGTARMLVRSINQAMDIVNQAIWPEMTHLLSSGQVVKAARLHRLGVGASIMLSGVGFISLLLFGGILYETWVGKAIHLPQNLLVLFLIPIPFNALWFTSSVTHLACNQHEELAVRYILATSLALAACALFSYYLGIEGAALSTIIADIILIPFVLKRSLQLTQESWASFGSGMVQEGNVLIKSLLKRKALASLKTGQS